MTTTVFIVLCVYRRSRLTVPFFIVLCVYGRRRDSPPELHCYRPVPRH